MVTEILPNFYKVEIPMPGSPLKALNSYVIKSPQRNLIVDTGWDRSECMQVMLSGLQELEVNLGNTDFFITHFHPDHLGLVFKLAPDTAKIYFNQPDADQIEAGLRREDFYDFACANGFPDNDFQALLRDHPSAKYKLNRKPGFHILKENDILSVGEYGFKCIETPGHSKGHLCLYEKKKKVFVSGDHILSGITPIIQLWSHEGNPLKHYLASLDKTHALDIDLVLPGHLRSFRNCKERIQEIKYHRLKRCTEILSSLGRRGKNAFRVASEVNWSTYNKYDSWNRLPPLQKWFATGETIAYLKYLEDEGKIRKQTSGVKIKFYGK